MKGPKRFPDCGDKEIGEACKHVEHPEHPLVIVGTFCLFLLLLLRYATAQETKVRKKLEAARESAQQKLAEAQARYEEAQRPKRVQQMLARVEEHHHQEVMFENDVDVASQIRRRIAMAEADLRGAEGGAATLAGPETGGGAKHVGETKELRSPAEMYAAGLEG